MKISELLVVFSFILASKAETFITGRRKRGNQDNFNVLLNIYKMNPLQQSNVYRTFSNRLLLPRPNDKHADMNLNLKESIKETQNRIHTKKGYGEILYYSTPYKLDKNPLNIEKAESFDSGNFLDSLMSLNQIDYEKKRYDDSDIFGSNLKPFRVSKKSYKDKLHKNTDKNKYSIDLDSEFYMLKKKTKRGHKENVNYENAEVVLV